MDIHYSEQHLMRQSSGVKTTQQESASDMKITTIGIDLAKEFKNGRQLSTWMGLALKQHPSGGQCYFNLILPDTVSFSVLLARQVLQAMVIPLSKNLTQSVALEKYPVSLDHYT